MTRIRFYCGMTDKDGERLIESRKYRATLDRFYTGYTEYMTTGMWQGETEESRVFEVLVEGLPAPHVVREAAQALKDTGNQSAVLVTIDQVEGYCV